MSVSDLAAVAAAVDPRRVIARLDELAAFGAEPDGGVTRIAFSPEERKAQELVVSWMRKAGLEVRFDDFGNMFGSTDANAPDAAVSMAGSHIDTVPSGGRYDGALGVIAAVEAVEAMRTAARLPERPLEVVVWRCEEPVRFSQGKVGSMLFAGLVSVDELRPLGDEAFDLAAELDAERGRPSRDPSRRVASCLELHIEQGSRLERAGRQIGVVTAIAAPVRVRARVDGRADHSGATPMRERLDALCGAAEFALAVEASALAEAEHETVATTVTFESLPGAMNVVPGEATLLVDIRGIDEASMQRVLASITERGARIAKDRGLALKLETLSAGVPARLREDVVARVAAAARAVGFDPLLLASGAGHDAQCLAATADVGMIFVPSVNGVSHSPAELTNDADVEAGARALAAAWFDLASAPGRPRICEGSRRD